MLQVMTVSGIRSFAPDTKDKNRIRFFSPLTLILGANGCGKTTLIECLKYMTTGVLPPGSKGVAFVHDPKLDHQSVSKGQVKLEFLGANGHIIRAHRNLQVQIMGGATKKAQFKTIDVDVEMKNETAGSWERISGKCMDVDKDICMLMGVSKAVLEHVIFCHQEDANWPLGEGKAVKQRFDEIFASGRYSKALDEIHKLQKENTTEISKFRIELTYLLEKKQRAGALRKKKNELEKLLARTEEPLQKLRAELDRLSSEMAKLDKNEQKALQLQKVQMQVEAEYKSLTSRISDLARNVSESRQRDAFEELQRELQRVKARQSIDYEATMRKLDVRKDELLREQSKFQQAKQNLAASKAELAMLERNLEEKVRERTNIIRQASSTLQHPDPSSFSIATLSQEIEELEAKVAAVRERATADERAIEKKLTEANGQLAFIEQTIRDKTVEKSRLETELRKAEDELSEVATSGQRTAHLQREIEEIELKLEVARADLAQVKADTDMEKLKGDRAKLEEKQQSLVQQLSKANKTVEAQAALTHLRGELDAKKGQVSSVETKLCSNLQVSYSGQRLISELQSRLDSASRLVAEKNEKLDNLKNKLAKLNAESTSLNRQISDKQAAYDRTNTRLKDALSRMGESSTVTGLEELDNRLSDLDLSCSTAQDELSDKTSHETLMQSYISGMERRSAKSKDHSSCPLCERGFQTEAERTKTVDSIRTKLASTPQEKATLRGQVDDFRKKIESLRAVKPSFNDLTRLDTELKELKRTLSGVAPETEDLACEVAGLQSEVAEARSNFDRLKELQSDANELKRLNVEVEDLESRVQTMAYNQSSSMRNTAAGGGQLSAAQISAKLDEVAFELKLVTGRIESAQNRFEEAQADVTELEHRSISLKQDLVDLDRRQQRRCQLEERRTALSGDLERCRRALDDAKSKSTPTSSEARSLERERTAIRERRDTELAQVNKQADVLRDLQRKYDQVSREIRRIEESTPLSERKTTLQAKETRLDEDLSNTLLELERVQREAVEIQGSLTNQRQVLRELNDAIELHEKRSQLAEVSGRKTEAEDQITQLGGTAASLRERRLKLSQQHNEYFREKTDAESTSRTQRDQLADVDRQLREEYAKAEENYRAMAVKVTLTEMANDDLKQFYRELDRALLTYHTRKMSEINRIIAEIWQQTYKGGDIDTVEIKADVEADATGAAAAPANLKTRRSYNYRVVMRKGDIELDMRGRCSAGQKVLASIIIRLALAETFGGSCGVLALDEPTTNLDRENIEALAMALSKVIKSRCHRQSAGDAHRSNASDFQLIIISHDEDFVEILGRLTEMADEFYRLERDDEGRSMITRESVTSLEMQARLSQR